MKGISLLAAALVSGGLAVGANAQQASPRQLVYAQSLAPSAVRTVQSRLRSAGDYSGRLDGIWGPDSIAALERFQQTHGLQPTGQLNPATTVTLGIDPAMLLQQPETAAAAPQSTVLTPGTVRDVQRRLAQLGYYQGPQDGIWGPATQDALVKFQQGRGLQPNSQLNPATAAALGMSSAMFAERPIYQPPDYTSAVPSGSKNCGTPDHWKACR